MKKFRSIKEKIKLINEGRIAALDAISVIGDIYLFGIWSGMSTDFISRYLAGSNIEYNKMFGFDSFTGFPEDKEEGFHDGFRKEVFSSATLYDCTPEKAVAIIKNGISNKKLRFIPGYYSNILNEGLVVKEGMCTANYIDIDVDLYSSAFDVLTFMFMNNLVTSGTIIYFDDWGLTEEYRGGESLAWLNATKNYGIEYEEIYSCGSGPNIMKVFKTT